MKSKNAAYSVSLVVMAFCTFGSSVVTASPWQDWRGSNGWGLDSPYQRMYEPAKVEMVSGQVVDIEKSVPMRGMGYGVIIIVRTEKEVVPVHLGPVWYIERLDCRILTRDRLEIKGSRIFLNDKPAFIAAEIKKGDQFLILRDNLGVPVWTGWGWKRSYQSQRNLLNKGK